MASTVASGDGALDHSGLFRGVQRLSGSADVPAEPVAAGWAVVAGLAALALLGPYTEHVADAILYAVTRAPEVNVDELRLTRS